MSNELTPLVSDRHVRFLSELPASIEQASTAMKTDAFSWRELFVGCSMSGENASLGEYGMLAAGNIKNNQHVETVCAEGRAQGMLTKAGLIDVPGFVVVSNASKEQIRDISQGRKSCTLYPCFRCLSRFDNNDQVGNDSVAVTAGWRSRKSKSIDVIEAHTVGELRVIEALGPVDLTAGPTITSTRDWSARVEYFTERSVAQAHLEPRQRISPGQLVVEALRARL